MPEQTPPDNIIVAPAYFDENKRRAARALYSSAVSMRDLVTRNGEDVGLEPLTIINVAVEFNNFVTNLNQLTDMKFEKPVGFSEDKGFRASPLVAAIEQVKLSVRSRTKKSITGLRICTPTYELLNVLLCQNFTIYMEVDVEGDSFVLGMNDKGQAIMSERRYWEAPRFAAPPTPTPAPTPAPTPEPEPPAEPVEP